MRSFDRLAVDGTAATGGHIPSATPLKGIRFLLPRAEIARELFPEKVRELGGIIDVPVAYRAIKPDHHGKRLKRFLKEGRITVATFTSAATFYELQGDDGRGCRRASAKCGDCGNRPCYCKSNRKSRPQGPYHAKRGNGRGNGR